ncbi:MAG: dihydrolipoyllysine-residue acetyltransferase [Solirubrobacteraceae bacterium]|nr:dihydrolipoyllysine-residue acetyltransferase [Solirubrobacteraceae bacterium]
MAEVAVPDIGDFEGIPIIEVLVAVGDTVEVEQGLVEIESDKATFEVPSPVAGVVKELRVAVGDKVSEGVVIAVVDETGGDGAPGDVGATPDTAPKPVEAKADETKAEAAAEADRPSGRALARQEGRSTQEPAGQTGSATQAVAGQPAGGGALGADHPVYASPTVRRLARERGIDLSQVKGSGDKGRITKADVEGFDPKAAGAAGASAAAGADAGESLGLAPWPVVNFEKLGPVTREPLTKIQKLSAANLARNWVRIPHVTHNDEADITDLEAFRKTLNAEQSDVKVTMVALLLKASVASLKAFPRFNASLDGEELVVKHFYNVGFAADTPNGLVVPVVKDVDQKGILELAGEVGELSAKARAGKLMPAQMSGGNFSISSLGGIGGTSFTPIVNAPEVAILGVVRSAMKPVWNGKEFAPRLMLPLSLSYDHRVIDGALAARFTVHLAKTLSDFRRVVL